MCKTCDFQVKVSNKKSNSLKSHKIIELIQKLKAIENSVF